MHFLENKKHKCINEWMRVTLIMLISFNNSSSVPDLLGLLGNSLILTHWMSPFCLFQWLGKLLCHCVRGTEHTLSRNAGDVCIFRNFDNFLSIIFLEINLGSYKLMLVLLWLVQITIHRRGYDSCRTNKQSWLFITGQCDLTKIKLFYLIRLQMF